MFDFGALDAFEAGLQKQEAKQPRPDAQPVQTPSVSKT